MCYRYLEYVEEFEELSKTPRTLKEVKAMIDKLIENNGEDALVSFECNSNEEPGLYLVAK